jgi:hypothetical protein
MPGGATIFGELPDHEQIFDYCWRNIVDYGLIFRRYFCFLMSSSA